MNTMQYIFFVSPSNRNGSWWSVSREWNRYLAPSLLLGKLHWASRSHHARGHQSSILRETWQNEGLQKGRGGLRWNAWLTGVDVSQDIPPGRICRNWSYLHSAENIWGTMAVVPAHNSRRCSGMYIQSMQKKNRLYVCIWIFNFFWRGSPVPSSNM